MERWCGRVAVVTGASAGIGYAISEKLVENGLKVVGLARRLERLDEMTAKFKGMKGTFFGHKTDISNKDDIEAAFKFIQQNIGPISILVNNAGLGRPDTIINGNLDNWKKIVDTNFYGLTVTTSLALNNMKENGIDDGHIININSIAGHSVLPFPKQNVYPATKFAVTAFTETVRKEVALSPSKIRITSVSPGLVDTEIFVANEFDKDSDFQKFRDISPILSSEDVADAVLYVIGTPPNVQITELTIKPTGEMM